ncbi:MAG: glycosyltransferase family 2 protein [Zoogloeaceae bacterium]|nr:glycosyltransferase family 2 protein [Zoogloeaceae bacterium]
MSQSEAFKAVPVLAVVVPCFNEQDVLPGTIETLGKVLGQLIERSVVAEDSFLCFVDDGSRDTSWDLIKNSGNHRVKGVKLSLNFGHQNALLAGLLSVMDRCDAAISIDADLQQDPWAMEAFIEKYVKGADVVFGVRRDRASDGIFKKLSARAFYRLMQLMGVNIIPDHADYRLLSRRAIGWLAQHKEPGLFLRAICMQLGLQTAIVHFDVSARMAGESKYSLSRMMSLGLNGITSFSVMPLRLIATLGVAIFFLSGILGFYVLWRTIFVGDVVPGWASTTLPIYFLGGIQILCLALIGEYVAQLLVTVKARPRYLVEEELF